jgi:hypothetical protein
MPVWLALSGTLGLNYWRHRKGRSTLCSSARPVISAEKFIFGWGVLTGWIIPHFCKSR